MALEGSERELMKFGYGQYDHEVIDDTNTHTPGTDVPSGAWYWLLITEDAAITSLHDSKVEPADYATFGSTLTITDDDAPGTNSVYVVQSGTLSDGKVTGYLEAANTSNADVEVTIVGDLTLTIYDNDAASGDDVWLDYNEATTTDRLVSEVTGDVDVYIPTSNSKVWVKITNVADEDADNSSAVFEKSGDLVSTVQDNADKAVAPVTTDPYNGLSVSANACLYGDFSLVQLASGSAIAYSGPGY